MMKWQGMFLSEHTSALQEDRIADEYSLFKHNALSENEIYQRLEFAFTKNKLINIQVGIKNIEGQLQNYVSGRIEGFGDDSVWLTTQQKVLIEEIEYIEILNTEDFES
jgi:hypothetical protein